MNLVSNGAGTIALALALGLLQPGCGPRAPRTDDAAPAPLDSGITSPSNASRDTPPAAARSGKPANQAPKDGGLKVSQKEYEGWRQYSVNCARCHGQDVLPNPVAANLLLSVRSGGPIDTREKFVEVVTKGRPERGMPAFSSLLSPEQINAISDYVEGRAQGRIPPGRPESPA